MTTKFDGVRNLFGRIEGKDLPQRNGDDGFASTPLSTGKLDGQFGVLAS